MHQRIVHWTAPTLTAILLAAGLAGCTPASSADPSASSGGSTALTGAQAAEFLSLSDEDSDSSFDPDSTTKITLSGTGASVSGTGASVSGNTVVISSAGSYLLEGTLTDGQILILANKSDTVRLILNGASVTSSTGAAINGQQAGKIIVTLAEGSENTLCDGTGYADGDDAPTGTLYAKNDLTINGSGSLTVTGNCNNGIAAKDHLIITGGTIRPLPPEPALESTTSILRCGYCADNSFATVFAKEKLPDISDENAI